MNEDEKEAKYQNAFAAERVAVDAYTIARAKMLQAQQTADRAARATGRKFRHGAGERPNGLLDENISSDTREALLELISTKNETCRPRSQRPI